MCGITVGKDTMVAAGSIVTKGVPDDGRGMGVPARTTSLPGEEG